MHHQSIINQENLEVEQIKRQRIEVENTNEVASDSDDSSHADQKSEMISFGSDAQDGTESGALDEKDSFLDSDGDEENDF